MTQCEIHEMQISALLDGEANLHEQVCVIDHILICPSCRHFYEEARALQDLVDTLPLDEHGAELDRQETGPGALAEGEKLAALSARKGRRSVPIPSWAWAAAAIVLVALSFWSGGKLQGRAEPEALALPAIGEAIDVQLASRQGEMSEAQFVGLALELLRADRRYHEQMFHILQLLDLENPIRSEGRITTARNRSEGDYRIDIGVEQGGPEDAEPEPPRAMIY